MKKLLVILGAVGLSATMGNAVISCSWNTPPISMESISKIMKITKDQVLNGGLENEKSIPQIFGGAVKISGWPDPAIDQETAFKNWSDPITGQIASTLATKPVGDNLGGLINQQKNILTGEPSDDWKEISDLKEFQSYHMTIIIADIARIEGDTLTWISQELEGHLEDLKVDQEPIKIDAQQLTADGSQVSESGNYKIFKFLELDSKKWEELASHKGDYRFRFLIKVSPKKTEPVFFYLDQVMEK